MTAAIFFVCVVAWIGMSVGFVNRAYALGRRHGREWERMLRRHAHERIVEEAQHAIDRAAVLRVRP